MQSASPKPMPKSVCKTGSLTMGLHCAGHGCFVSKLQWSKLQIAGLKEEFAGLKMGPFGGPVFGAAFLGKREK